MFTHRSIFTIAALFLAIALPAHGNPYTTYKALGSCLTLCGCSLGINTLAQALTRNKVKTVGYSLVTLAQLALGKTILLCNTNRPKKQKESSSEKRYTQKLGYALV